jgi:hypothetical protein
VHNRSLQTLSVVKYHIEQVMHKTGACLPKLGQADPLGQALVLDPGLPPEQLLAPALTTGGLCPKGHFCWYLRVITCFCAKNHIRLFGGYLVVIF